MICFAKLPLTISIADIKEEVNNITELWYPHLNIRDYQGGWDVISLRSPGGASNNIIPDVINHYGFANTPLMDTCPSIKKIIDELNCPVMAVRLLNLKSGAKIKPHKDHELAFENGEVRIHIPVFTNNQVEFYVEDNLVQMNAGDCWYMNANLTHSVSNNGETDRIHLVIDCKVNDKLTELFEKADKTTRDEDYDVNEKLMIIEALRQHNNSASAKLADEIEMEVNSFLKKNELLPSKTHQNNISETINKIFPFFDEIGIAYQLECIKEETLLPGLQLKDGTLVIDMEKLLYPGDILHEAGHLACMPIEIRRTMSGDLEDNDMHRAGEMMAIAWSYAVCVHLKIDKKIVFHDDGYRGGSDDIIHNFDNDLTFGVPMLQWNKMCYDNQNAIINNAKPFPEMISWTCKVNNYKASI